MESPWIWGEKEESSDYSTELGRMAVPVMGKWEGSWLDDDCDLKSRM